MQVMNFSTTNCKNCYKCVRTCEIKAIEVINDSAHIIPERCVACGHCLVVCPQNARDVKSSLAQVIDKVEKSQKIVVSIAPSYRGYFEKSGQLIAALRRIGFNRIEETAVGAEVVSQEYEKYIVESDDREFITTCCPSTVRLIERYYSDLIHYMIPIVSPMIAHGRIIKEENPTAYTVFIGPCISKICESLSDDLKQDIDAVITFDEITNFLEEQNICLEDLESEEPDYVGSLRGSKYPVVGGVLNSIRPTLDKMGIEVLRVHGMEQSTAVLTALRAGKLKNVCIEINSCSESCIAGPGGHNQPGSIFSRLQAVQRYLRSCNEEDIPCNKRFYTPKVSFVRQFKNKQVPIHTASEEEIIQVLESMGKNELKDELNCGACGYKTCRDKAIAVINGMSHIDMCLPYTRSIAERLSNEIFYNSPNSILILDKRCQILDINPQAEERFGYKAELMKGKPISIMMDDTPFYQVVKSKTSSGKEKVKLEVYDFIGYRDIIYLEKQKALLIIFADVTDEEKRKQELVKLKGNTLDLTQSIIDKQMRVAQEIASLLGETTAETKVAIMKLKNVLQEEGEC